jgi:hypothetical protein
MPKMVKEIQKKFEVAREKNPKVRTIPGFPIRC